MPFQLKRLRAALRQREVGEVVVKKRGFASDPERIREQLRLDRNHPNRAVVVLTRVGEQPYAVITVPVPRRRKACGDQVAVGPAEAR